MFASLLPPFTVFGQKSIVTNCKSITDMVLLM